MRDGLVSKDELEEILAQQHDTRQQRISGRRLGEILIQCGRVTPVQVAKLVAEQYELPFLELELSDIDVRAAAVLSEEDARRFWALPVSRRHDGSYLLAIADPATVLFSDELRKRLGSVPRFAVVGPDAIERAIEYAHSQPLQFPSVVALEPVPTDPVAPTSETEESFASAVVEDSAPRSLAQTWPPLGALLVREGLLTDADLDTALAQQRLSPSHRLGEILVEKGIVTSAVVARLVAEQYELPFVELETHPVDPEVARRLPEEIARRRSAVPVGSHDGTSIELAISDPTSAVYSDELQQALDAPLFFVVAAPDAIDAVLDAVHAPEHEPTAVQAPETEPTAADEELAEGFERAVSLNPPETHVEWRIVEAPAPETALEPVDEVATEPSAFGGLREAFEPGVAGEVVLEDHALDVDAEPEAESSEETEVEASTSSADSHALGEEPSWAGRLALVDEIAWSQEPEQGEEHAFELSLLPAPEASEVEDEAAEETAQEASWSVEDGPEPAPLAAFPTPWEATAPDEGPLSGPSALEPVEVPETMAVEAATEPTPPAPEPQYALETEFEDVEPLLEVATEAEEVLWAEPADESELEVEAEIDFTTVLDGVLAAGATTIHFSPLGAKLTVRARVDGAVRDVGTASHAERDAVVERLEREELVRTHVVATSRGEKTTLFVREPAGTPTAIEELGADAAATNTLRTALARPFGTVLVCGPGGSGTTTTLYAALRACATPNRIVTTVEHPVERLVSEVDQIDVDPASSETFASALRELRFTDPDVVLVGELGDLETAEVALRTASEGHLVLTSRAVRGGTAAALVSLAEMGVDPTLLGSAVTCVVAQRLVRSICPECRETHYASDAELEALGQHEVEGPRLLARGRGCPACDGSGFRGRVAIFEVLAMTEEIDELVREGASAKKIQRAAVTAGVRTLRDEGIRLCLEGATTVAEVERVLGADG